MSKTTSCLDLQNQHNDECRKFESFLKDRKMSFSGFEDWINRTFEEKKQAEQKLQKIEYKIRKSKKFYYCSECRYFGTSSNDFKECGNCRNTNFLTEYIRDIDEIKSILKEGKE